MMRMRVMRLRVMRLRMMRLRMMRLLRQKSHSAIGGLRFPRGALRRALLLPLAALLLDRGASVVDGRVARGAFRRGNLQSGAASSADDDRSILGRGSGGLAPGWPGSSMLRPSMAAATSSASHPAPPRAPHGHPRARSSRRPRPSRPVPPPVSSRPSPPSSSPSRPPVPWPPWEREATHSFGAETTRTPLLHGPCPPPPTRRRRPQRSPWTSRTPPARRVAERLRPRLN